MRSPTPLPLPADCPVIVPGTPSTATGDGDPLYWELTVTQGSGWLFWLGQNLTFTVKSDTPVNLGIYGPNPSILGIGPDGKTSGRMRAPKVGQRDATSSRCQGNFSPGTYYLVVRSGDNDPPDGNVTVNITSASWKIFG